MGDVCPKRGIMFYGASCNHEGKPRTLEELKTAKRAKIAETYEDTMMRVDASFRGRLQTYVRERVITYQFSG